MPSAPAQRSTRLPQFASVPTRIESAPATADRSQADPRRLSRPQGNTLEAEQAHAPLACCFGQIHLRDIIAIARAGIRYGECHRHGLAAADVKIAISEIGIAEAMTEVE